MHFLALANEFYFNLRTLELFNLNGAFVTQLEMIAPSGWNRLGDAVDNEVILPLKNFAQLFLRRGIDLVVLEIGRLILIRPPDELGFKLQVCRKGINRAPNQQNKGD